MIVEVDMILLKLIKASQSYGTIYSIYRDNDKYFLAQKYRNSQNKLQTIPLLESELKTLLHLQDTEYRNLHAKLFINISKRGKIYVN